MRNKALI